MRINQDSDTHVYSQSHEGTIDGSDFKLQIVFVLRNYTAIIIFRIFETSYSVRNRMRFLALDFFSCKVDTYISLMRHIAKAPIFSIY